MKKIFKLRKNDGFYEPYYGENYAALDNDNALLPEGYEYEMEQYTTLDLLWTTFMDFGVIPRNLINEGKITSHGNFVTGKIIDDKVLICWLPAFEQNGCLKIGIEALKDLWLKYLGLQRENIDEIVLERDGDQFSIYGIWFDNK